MGGREQRKNDRAATGLMKIKIKMSKSMSHPDM